VGLGTVGPFRLAANFNKFAASRIGLMAEVPLRVLKVLKLSSIGFEESSTGLPVTRA